MNRRKHFTGYSRGLAIGVLTIALTAAVGAASVENAYAYDLPHGVVVASKNIVATATSEGSFETLITTARTSGLDETL